MQQDLNNLAVFAAVVEYGSFTAAAEHLEIGKSQVSQRIARLEQQLDMHLIHRTTRQQQVTDFGHDYYQHCRAMLDAAEQAQQVAEQAKASPSGRVHVACPPLFSEMILGPVVVDFIQAHPGVILQVDQTYRDIDVVRDGYDLVVRIREHIDDSSLVARALGRDQLILVASPELLARRPISRPRDLTSLPSLSLPAGGVQDSYQWTLQGPRGAARRFRHTPRLISDDLLLLRAAAAAGHGVAALPSFLCTEQIGRGELCRVLPKWNLPGVTVHGIYPSRQGQPPAVRSFMEFLAPRIAKRLDELHAPMRGVI